MRVASWATFACVVPSALWRSAVGLGTDLGWSDDQLAQQQIPGTGTAYVLALSASTLLAAILTVRLAQPDGDRMPLWIPALGGRRVPRPVVAAIAFAGALTVTYASFSAVSNWSAVSGFADRPASAAARFMALCYAPALLWGPLLCAVTIGYLLTGRTHQDATRQDARTRRMTTWHGRAQADR